MAGRFFTTSATWEDQEWYTKILEYHSITSFIEKKRFKKTPWIITFLSKKKYVCFILLKRKLRLKYVKKLSSKLHCYEIYVRLFFKIYFLKSSLFKRKPIILSTTRLNMGRAEKEDKTNCIHYKVLSMQKT